MLNNENLATLATEDKKPTNFRSEKLHSLSEASSKISSRLSVLRENKKSKHRNKLSIIPLINLDVKDDGSGQNSKNDNTYLNSTDRYLNK